MCVDFIVSWRGGDVFLFFRNKKKKDKKIGEFVCCLYSFGLYNRDDGRS